MIVESGSDFRIECLTLADLTDLAAGFAARFGNTDEDSKGNYILDSRA